MNKNIVIGFGENKISISNRDNGHGIFINFNDFEEIINIYEAHKRTYEKKLD